MSSMQTSILEIFASFIQTRIDSYEASVAGMDLTDTHISGLAAAAEGYPEYAVNLELRALLVNYSEIGYTDSEKLSELRNFVLKKVSNWHPAASSNQVENAMRALTHSTYTKLITLVSN